MKSVQFKIRLERKLHRQLEAVARKSHRSLSKEITCRIEETLRRDQIEEMVRGIVKQTCDEVMGRLEEKKTK